MSNFTQNGPYGGPFAFHTQYPPAPPPPPGFNVMPQIPFPQHRPPPFHQQLPHGTHPVQYPNSAAFHNNGQYGHQMHGANMPPPPLTPRYSASPYFNYAQYNPSVQPPFPSPTGIPPFHAAQNHNPQLGPPPVASAPKPQLRLPPKPQVEQTDSVDTATLKKPIQLPEEPMAEGGNENNEVMEIEHDLTQSESPGEHIQDSQTRKEAVIEEDPPLYPTEDSSDPTSKAASISPEPGAMQSAGAPKLHEAIPATFEIRRVRSRSSQQNKVPEIIDVDAYVPPQDTDVVIGSNSVFPRPASTDALEIPAQESIAPKELQSQRKNPTILREARAVKREAVKKALWHLYDNEIGFDDLLAEAIDPTLLRELYSEAGIPVPTISIPLQPDKPSQPKSSLMNSLSSPKSASVAARERSPALAVRRNNQGVAGTRSDQASTHEYSPRTSLLDFEQPRSEEKHDMTESQSRVDTIANTLSNTSISQNKALPGIPRMVASQDQSQSRQDYIARLLAAKEAVKPKEAVKQPPSSFTENEITAKAVVDIPAENTTESGSLPAAVPFLEHKKAEAKDTTQTELVRQRLEALRNNDKRQRSSSAISREHDDTSMSPTLAVSEQLATFDGNVDTANHTSHRALRSATEAEPSPETVSYSPENPFFAFGNRRPFPGLPGLGFSEADKSQQMNQQDIETPKEDLLPVISTPGELVQSQPNSFETPPLECSPIANAGSDITTAIAIPQLPGLSFAPPVAEPRRRVTAADFMNGPPTASRRSTVNDRIECVIEVSDAESGEVSDREDDVEEPLRPNSSAALPKPVAVSSEKKVIATKAFRDVPPLSNFPSRLGPGSGPGTPSSSHTPKNLARAEEEIRELNRKIAEMERRKRIKISADTSRPQSTPLLNTAHTENETEKLETINQRLLEQEKSIADAKSVLQEKLAAENQLQAKVAAKVDLESMKVATASSEAERQARLKRKATLEATLPQLDAQIENARRSLEEMIRQEEEIKAEIKRGNDGRKALFEELTTLLKDLEEDEILEAAGEGDLEMQGQLKGSPKLLEIDHLSNSPKKPEAARSRDVTADPIMTTSSMPLDQTRSASRASVTSEQPLLPVSSIQQPFDSDADEGEIVDHRPTLDAPAAPLKSKSRDPEAASSDSGSSPVEINDLDTGSTSDYEPTDTAMDILKPNSIYSEQPTEEMEVDEYEVYEPRPEDRIGKTPDAPISIHSANQSSEELYSPGVSNLSPPPLEPRPSTPDSYDPKLAVVRTKSVQAHEEGEASESASMSDPYDPPEAPPPVDNHEPAGQPQEPQQDHKSPEPSEEARLPTPGYQAEEPELIMKTATAIYVPAEEKPRGTSEKIHEADFPRKLIEDSQSLHPIRAKYGHYAPYQSPLSLFTSYRFHPQFAEDVPGGFRSLTYSHKIVPREPVCSTELSDGVCNDPSCRWQHFKDMSLNDNTILLQLGSVPEGASIEDRDAYVSGLKKIIAGMRDRNLKDVSAVAAEIVAYRTKFLGDKSRVLASLDS